MTTVQAKTGVKLMMADGQTVAGRDGTTNWQVVGSVGEGGFGKVYRVVRVGDKRRRQYAMKIEQDGDNVVSAFIGWE